MSAKLWPDKAVAAHRRPITVGGMTVMARTATTLQSGRAAACNEVVVQYKLFFLVFSKNGGNIGRLCKLC